MNFVAQELKPKEKIYLVNKLHASCRLSHSAHVKTLRKTIIITKEKKYQRRFFGQPGAVVGCIVFTLTLLSWCRWNSSAPFKSHSPHRTRRFDILIFLEIGILSLNHQNYWRCEIYCLLINTHSTLWAAVMITPGAIKVAPPIKNSSRLQSAIGLPSPSKPMFEIIILIRNQMLFNHKQIIIHTELFSKKLSCFYVNSWYINIWDVQQ